MIKLIKHKWAKLYLPEMYLWVHELFLWLHETPDICSDARFPRFSQGQELCSS